MGVHSLSAVARNVCFKVLRRLGRLHKPLLRRARRGARFGEHLGYRFDEHRVLREIAAVARGREPILIGPWLAEVGYEALYWVPFVRWFVHVHRVPATRLTVMSRGGTAPWYGALAGRYVELFDFFTPKELAIRNEARRLETESGGQKQSALSSFDVEIMARAAREHGIPRFKVLHPSLMFRLFNQFWLGNQAPDFLWRHTTHATFSVDGASGLDLPDRYVAAKLYTGRALPDTAAVMRNLRRIIERVARKQSVVLLETGFTADDHRDHALGDLSNVHRLDHQLTPSTNLATQTQVIAGADQFIGTCGGLAWLAPLLGVPTVALYADDYLLTTHLAVARHVYHAVDAAEFSTLDLRMLDKLVPVS